MSNPSAGTHCNSSGAMGMTRESIRSNYSAAFANATSASPSSRMSQKAGDSYESASSLADCYPGDHWTRDESVLYVWLCWHALSGAGTDDSEQRSCPSEAGGASLCSSLGATDIPTHGIHAVLRNEGWIVGASLQTPLRRGPSWMERWDGRWRGAFPRLSRPWLAGRLPR